MHCEYRSLKLTNTTHIGLLYFKTITPQHRLTNRHSNIDDCDHSAINPKPLKLYARNLLLAIFWRKLFKFPLYLLIDAHNVNRRIIVIIAVAKKLVLHCLAAGSKKFWRCESISIFCNLAGSEYRGLWLLQSIGNLSQFYWPVRAVIVINAMTQQSF